MPNLPGVMLRASVLAVVTCGQGTGRLRDEIVTRQTLN
jgi:hypothetical protein